MNRRELHQHAVDILKVSTIPNTEKTMEERLLIIAHVTQCLQAAGAVPLTSRGRV